MRFLVVLRSLEPATVSVDYRSRFIALLKKALGPEEFEGSSPRAYTFAVFFQDAIFEDKLIKNVQKINFRFSTCYSVLAVRFYTSMARLKESLYMHPIGTGKFIIESIKEEREQKVNGCFKTLSPVVVQRISEAGKYLLPADDLFNESLLENTLKRFASIKGYIPRVKEFKFVPVEIKPQQVKHYGGNIPAFLGRFRIETESEELLKFVYQCGLGVRTGQGFGYLEVDRCERGV